MVLNEVCFAIYRSIATTVSQLKIWHFWATGIGRNVCKCTFNRYSVITQFAKLAAGEQLCRRCTHTKLYHFKAFKSFSWKITHFELWQCCVVTVLCCDTVVLWQCCVVTLLCCDTVVLWHCCVVTVLCCDTCVVTLLSQMSDMFIVF